MFEKYIAKRGKGGAYVTLRKNSIAFFKDFLYGWLLNKRQSNLPGHLTKKIVCGTELFASHTQNSLMDSH